MRTLDDIIGVGACDACRGRITKCSIERPSCSECRKRDTRCIYSELTDRRSATQPLPDPNAPRKPKPAYVLFGEHVQKDPALSHVPLADIEKAVERRWQELSQEERVSRWERPAFQRLKSYEEELERYKKTESYRTYQTYLETFKKQWHSPKTRILPDSKALSTSETALSAQLSVFPEHEDLDGYQPMVLDPYDPGLEGQPHDMTSPVKCGMTEVRNILTAQGINPDLIRVAAYPSEEVTTRAVEDFLNGTGALLHLWDQEEAMALTKSVYHPQNDGTSVHATEVFAMAAVGSYCDGKRSGSFFRERFLEFFLCLLSSNSSISELRCMRLFGCLAIIRFANNVESARELILATLNIGRQQFRSSSFLNNTTEEELRYWWNVFRSILFLESWFAYNTNHESRVTQEDLTLYHAPPSQAESGPAVFQERIRELGQLGAYIALDLKTTAQAKAEQARAHLESLDKWHRTLPPPMQLSQLSLARPFNMNAAMKRSLLQTHILFLGIFSEPYRKCLVDLGNFRLSNASVEINGLEDLVYLEEQCVLAARQSARVASLLQIDNLITARCWISIYTSFTSCAILLFSASQKLLGLYSEEIGQDLSYASSHLNLLSLCSYDNLIAKELYTKLQIVFNDIREVAVSPVYRKMRDARMFVKDPRLVPRSHYDSIAGAEEVSKSIVDSARRIMDAIQDALVLKE